MKNPKTNLLNSRFFKKIALLVLLFLPLIGFSQEETHHIEMADKMRADGLIYVVVLVLGTILIGIFITLYYLERRIRRIEKDIEKS